MVSIQFTCTENCSSNLDLLYYPTNTELGLPPLNSFMLVGQAQNGNNQLTGISTSGFYLAIRAMGGITVTIDRISVTATVCREDTVNLISFPEAYPSSTAVDGSCSDVNSEQGPDSGGLTGMCSSNGIWITSSSCVCRAGHFLDNVACSGTDIRVACTCTVHTLIIGGWCSVSYVYMFNPSSFNFTACPVETYKSTAGNEECSPCPRNSNASSMGSISCSCNPNYRRPNSNATDEDCSGNVSC